MSLTQLKNQAAHLEDVELRELLAFLVSLRTAKDQEFKRELARKIDDTDSTQWVELDELRKRYTD